MRYTPFDLVTSQDTHDTVSMFELSRASGLSMGELAELVDYGAITPVTHCNEDIVFSSVCITPLRHVYKLRVDYDLDVFTLALLLSYLSRIDELERQICAIEAMDEIAGDSV